MAGTCFFALFVFDAKISVCSDRMKPVYKALVNIYPTLCCRWAI